MMNSFDKLIDEKRYDSENPAEKAETKLILTNEDAAEKKIRIAFLITELSPGGAEKALTQLVLGLDRSKYDPVVYSMSGRQKDVEKSLAPTLRSHGIPVVELGLTRVSQAPIVFLKFCAALKKQRAQVLQTFMFHANILGRFAGRAVGVPVVCSGVRVAERDSKKRLAFDRLTSVLVDVWVCVGESTAEFTRVVGKIPRDRIVSISNGVQVRNVDGKLRVVTSGDLISKDAASSALSESDEHAAQPRGNRESSKPFGVRRRAIALGRLAPQKGFDWLLEHGLKAFPNDWELWIVGDGEERDRLTSLSARLGLEKRVYFTGWRSDASELAAASELFLLPSRWEGTPNVLLEAAALGKAALCTDVEGVAEVLGENGEPQICRLGDADEWAKKMTVLTNDDELRRELGRRNQERVLNEFTVERVVEQYDRLWTGLLDKGRAWLTENR